MEANTWVEEIMASSNGITKVNPNELLFAKIQYKINEIQLNNTPKHWVWIAAASFFILITLNIKIITTTTTTKDTKTETIATEIYKTNQLY